MSPHVLVVDPDPEVQALFARILGDDKFRYSFATSMVEASRLLANRSFDVVVASTGREEATGDGLDLLRHVQAVDDSLPVILVAETHDEALASAALGLQAFRYFRAPVKERALRRAVEKAVGLRRIARISHRGALASEDLEARYRNAFETMWIAHQPVVNASGKVIAYEALLRSEEPTLAHPRELLKASERLNHVIQLGERVHELAVRPLRTRPDVMLFVNVHPHELAQSDPFADSPLASYADRVVLEVAERHRLVEMHNLRAQLADLRQRGFRISLDDLGAGSSSVGGVVHLEPDFVKLDGRLIRGIEGSILQQRIVRAVVEQAQALQMQVVAECVESKQELRVLRRLGCELFQGTILARPRRLEQNRAALHDRRARRRAQVAFPPISSQPPASDQPAAFEPPSLRPVTAAAAPAAAAPSSGDEPTTHVRSTPPRDSSAAEEDSHPPTEPSPPPEKIIATTRVGRDLPGLGFATLIDKLVDATG